MHFLSPQSPFTLLSPRDLRNLSRRRKVSQTAVSAQHSLTKPTHFVLIASFTSNVLTTFIDGYASYLGIDHFTLEAAEFNQVLSVANAFDAFFDTHTTTTACFLFRLEDLTASSGARECADAFNNYLLPALGRFAENFGGQLILSLPPRPVFAETIADALNTFREATEIWHDSCHKIGALAKIHDCISLIDLDELIGRFGYSNSISQRDWMMYRNPFADIFSAHLSGQIVRHLIATMRPSKKCLVLDCDNTLWGGIIGEEGISGIWLSDEFPGRAFVEFQKTCKALSDSGVFLAISSKNDLAAVLEVFETHPAMVLKKEDIAVFSVNWNEKSINIQSIAVDLNIGTDSLVFIDDSDYELMEVSTHLPEVTCLKVPVEIAELSQLLMERRDLFDRPSITKDDKHRTDRMRHEVVRRQAQHNSESAMSHQEFMLTMNFEVAVYSPQTTDAPRLAQLINKTNQFNLTSRRYSLSDVNIFLCRNDIWCYALSARDKFGEYGLVGVCIINIEELIPRLDIFLMSCRVLNRGVETALIACVADDLAQHGHTTLCGHYIPTAKNSLCQTFLTDHGFVERKNEQASYAKTYVLQLDQRCPAPSYLSVQRQPFPGAKSEIGA